MYLWPSNSRSNWNLEVLVFVSVYLCTCVPVALEFPIELEFGSVGFCFSVRYAAMVLVEGVLSSPISIIYFFYSLIISA